MMITDIEDYFAKGCGRCDRFDTADCSTRLWVAGLSDLRRICLSAGLTEAVKWAHPCYIHAGRNVAIIGAFRTDFRLSFMNAGLLRDPQGILEKQGPNTRHPGMIRFTDNAQVARLEPVIRAYLAEATGYAAAGLRPPRDDRDLDLPEELIGAMESDPALAEAFHRLTPGRQKSYVFALNTTSNSATRLARIVRFRDKILAGKGALDR